MKYIFLVLLPILLFACDSGNQKITIGNGNNFEVTSKLVTISKREIEQVENKMPLIKKSTGELVPTQFVDADQDGDWDDMIFQVSIPAVSEMDFVIEWVPKVEYPTFKKQTQVYLGYSESRDGNFVSVDQSSRDRDHIPQKTPYTYQFEGPGWESNKVAFRSYFDSRNGKDIFGKTTEQMVTQRIGTGENYHTLQDWGMDVLKVGQSLGSGGLAILKNDSLIRLGETASAQFVKVDDGPIFSSFKLIYKGWNVLGQEYQLQEKISIQANKRWFRSEVTFLSGEVINTDTLVVGIVNLKEATVETVDHADMTALLTHGAQSENKDVLGMALLVSNKHFLNVSKAPTSGNGITNTELVYLNPQSNKYAYHFYAGWEMEETGFSSIEFFRNDIKKEMQEFSAELTILIQ